MVAHVDLVGDGLLLARHALRGQPAAAVVGELVEDRPSSPPVELGEPAQHGAGRLVAQAVVASPSAHSTPGDGGTITGQAPVSLPSALACSGPAPPNATSAKSRGSKPCCTETSRSPPSMFSLTMSTMPGGGGLDRLQAHRARRPSATAARAASTSSVISPPASDVGR